jgi:hypothetical protein
MTDTEYYDNDLGADLGDDSWDDGEGFTVNMSDKEASSEIREYEVLPSGYYRVKIDEVDLEEVKAGKNKGKPMFNFKLIIQDGPYAERSLYNRACLWEGALYTISQALQAQGLDPKSGRIPPARWWVGREMVAQVKVVDKKVKDGDVYVIERDENGKAKKSNDVGGYKATPADWDAARHSPKKPGTKEAKDAAARSAVDNLAP